MKKLSSDQLKLRDSIAAKLRDKQEDIESAIAAYNDVVEEARSFCDDVASSIDDYMSEKSEKWNESDKADKYNEWKSEYEDFECDGLVEDQDFVSVDDFEMLSEEVGE
jgi:hypothetical protein